MPPHPTLTALLAAANRADTELAKEATRKAARIAWVKETMAALRAAQKRVDEAWDRALDALPEDHSDEGLEALPEPPEQAELDAIHAQLDAVRHHDRWPEHLYFGGV